MGNAVTAIRGITTKRIRDPDADATANPISNPSKRPKRPSNMPSSSNTQYDVFISHAGEDKATIAIPLRERLMAKGITAFVDEADMQPGTDAEQAMVDAMGTAKVAVIVLSPEFVSRKWPMKELMCFLKRRGECANDGLAAPIVIPLFYRISIAELYAEPNFKRRDKDGNLLYRKSRFFERQKRGEPEANVDAIKSALTAVCGIMGLRNDVDASNDSSYLMSYRRGVLLQQLCDRVERAVPARAMQLRSEEKDTKNGHSQPPCDKFRKCFPPLSSGVQAVLDFNSMDENGNPKTYEGLVKQHLLQRRNSSSNVVSMHGIGGVGKSTILQALSVDDQIREYFPDGVHLIKLGRDASSATLFRQVYRILNESGAEKTCESLRTEKDMDAALHFFDNWFEKKRCAFFIDDAWVHGVGIALFSRLCKIGSGLNGNCVLITTREHEIASLAPRERTFEMKPRKVRGRIARDILLFHAGRREMNRFNTSTHDTISRVLDICAGLPVSLAVAGKNVKKMGIGMPNDEEGVWKRYLSQLVICREKLLKQDVGTYENLFATLATSISYLDEQSREVTLGFASTLSFAEMYRRLCVLEKQVAVPNSMLKHLWCLESKEYADVIATIFVEFGLARREAERDGRGYDYFSLHDSLHDFAVSETKRNGEVKDAHESLLDGYKSRNQEISCEWWSPKLETDGYIHRNLCRHLVEARRIAEVVQLLLSPQWVVRQLEVNDIMFLQADFSVGIKAIQGLRDERDENRRDTGEALQLISQAAALSFTFISSNKSVELYFQLHGRLKEYRDMYRAIDEYVGCIETDPARPRVLCRSSFLAQPGGPTMKIIPIGEAVLCMAIAKSGERIACGCRDGRIFVVNMKRNVVEEESKAHDNGIYAIAVLEDETLVISGSNDKTARLLDIETGHCVTIFDHHKASVQDIAVVRDGKRVISLSDDGTGIIWDAETGEILTELLTRRDDRITCMVVLGDEEEDLVLTGGADGKLRVWNLTTGAEVDSTFRGHDKRIRCIAVTADGRYIVSGSDDETVRMWDGRSHKQLGNAWKGHTKAINCVAVSGDGRRIVSGSIENMIRVWGMESQTEICDPLEGHKDYITGVSFLGDADHIVSCSRDGTLRVWDITRKATKNLRNRLESAVSSISFATEGRCVVSGSYDKTLCVLDTNSGEQVGNPLNGHSGFIRDIAVTPNGQYVVSVSLDMTARVWDLESRKLKHTLTGHTGWVQCVAVTPQGDRAVTGSDDKTIRVWNLVRMNSSHDVLEGHNSPVGKVFISDDGLQIVSVDYEDNIFVWELSSKKLVKQFTKENVLKLSRSEVLDVIGETTVHDDNALSIPLWGSKITYGEGASATVLATVESEIGSWALSPDKKTICVGMFDGQVGFMKLET